MNESKLYAYCLQGDVTAAYEYLRSDPDKNKKFQKLESKFYNRFFCENREYRFKTWDPWIRQVLLAYYEYFIFVLTRGNVLDAENILISSLKELLTGSQLTDNLDQLENQLKFVFNQKGYHFIGGVTPPFRGPYIWKTTVKQEFTVELPYHTQDVTVSFLSDFILQGWAHFATFGERFVGGWAKPDGLYYVNDRPKKKRTTLDSSEFQISYLKHEAQHLSDFSRYSILHAKDMEYRAKLVELIYEPQSLRLIKKFYYEQKNDPRLPHPYSSFVIMKRLSKFACLDEDSDLARWKKVDSERIQEWAWMLYEEHTKQLELKRRDKVMAL